MEIKITCINKDKGNHKNPYEAISHLEWKDYNSIKIGRNTREEMYDLIKNRGWIAFVEDTKGNKALVVTAISASGTKYVKTVADETKADNLLSLRECKL